MRPDAAAAVPVPVGDWCLFLDVDGTLLDLADTPGSVEVDEFLLPLLERLRVAASGAVALVTGRTIEDVDALLGTGHFPVAGLHGNERRDTDGRMHATPIAAEQLGRLREGLVRLAARNPYLLMEDKGAGLALHYVKAQHLGPELRAEVARLAIPGFEVLPGRAVIEVKPAAHTKGSAVTAFLRETPFANRTPIYLGDDITDRDGFAVVRRHEGIAIAVGPRVKSRWWLPGPAAVRGWLHRLLESSP